MPHDLLKHEWTALHQEHERFDRYGLLIKLTAVMVCLLSLAMGLGIVLCLALIAVLWLQEGIWRTIQARTSARLLLIERALNGEGEAQGLQHYSEWETKRPGGGALVKEYIANSLRPTVAYPYVLLGGIVIAYVVVNSLL